jgi:hypothetical protein
MDYQIIHSIPGRFRFFIPRLGTDPDYVQKLQGLLESIKFVTEVRINPWARSLIVSYKKRIISSEAVEKHLVSAIEQADSPAPSVSKENLTLNSLPKKNPTPTSSPSVSKPNLNQEQLKETSKIVTEEKHLANIPQQFPIEEDPWDLESKSNTISQPATKPVDEEMVSLKQKDVSNEIFSDSKSKPKEKEEKEIVMSLSTAALAKRLQVAHQTITRNRSKPNFMEWTQAKDPEGIAWSYDLKSKTFFQVLSNSVKVS